MSCCCFWCSNYPVFRVVMIPQLVHISFKVSKSVDPNWFERHFWTEIHHALLLHISHLKCTMSKLWYWIKTLAFFYLEVNTTEEPHTIGLLSIQIDKFKILKLNFERKSSFKKQTFKIGTSHPWLPLCLFPAIFLSIKFL